MKIINWNCKMNFRKDCQKVFDLNPDILVVPECEDINKYSIKPKIYSDSYWIGDNQNKGLAVFTFNNFKEEIKRLGRNFHIKYSDSLCDSLLEDN